MPSNFTPNYNLNQWEADDRVLRTDFNADNAKIDGAIKAQAEALEAESSARAAGDAALAGKLGNCKILHSTYTGNNTSGEKHPNKLEFTNGVPLLVIVVGQKNDCLMLTSYTYGNFNFHNGGFIVKWSDTGITWYSYGSAEDQLNLSNKNYHVFMFYPTE